MSQKLSIFFCIAFLTLSWSCTKTDQATTQQREEEAKEKTRQGAERVRDDAKKLAQDAKQDARSLDQKIDHALHDSGTGQADSSAEEKLRDGTRDLRVAGEKAGVKLDHAALLAKIKAKLASDVGLSTVATVDVDMAGQVVTLHGTVSSPEQRQQAEQSVLQVPGVTRVINELTVKP